MRTAAASLLVLALTMLALPAGAVTDVTPARVEGVNRVATAAAIAGLAHPEGTEHAVIANSGVFHDALAGNAYAGARGAAMLLTRADEVPDETRQALENLNVESVTLLGAEQAISADVSAELAEDYTVTRIGGEDEFDTAGGLALETVAITGGLPTVGDQATVMIASNEQFADALAASGIAYFFQMPILYTTPDALQEDATAAMAELEVERAVLLGGQATIAETVVEDLLDLGIDPDRIAGPTRVETSLFTADFSGFPRTQALLARGDDFPDAVTVGQLSGTLQAPVILSATPTVLPDTATAWFTEECDTLEAVRAVGGEAAVATSILEQAEQAAESCAADGDTDDEPTDDPDNLAYVVEPLEATEIEAGAEIAYQVTGRYDGAPLPDSLDILLFACDTTTRDASGRATFTDADGDGGADGLGTSDTGAAEFVTVEGDPVDADGSVVGMDPGADGVLSFRLTAEAEDCTVPVVLVGDGNGQVDVDEQGRALEEYGAGRVAWS